MHQMDVCTAYLNSDLSETVYMKQPEGYIDQSRPENRLLLKKAIYGLKQSEGNGIPCLTVPWLSSASLLVRSNHVFTSRLEMEASR